MATVSLSLETIRSEFAVNSVTAGEQQFPDVVSFGSGEFAVAYVSGDNVVLDTYESFNDTSPDGYSVAAPDAISTRFSGRDFDVGLAWGDDSGVHWDYVTSFGFFGFNTDVSATSGLSSPDAVGDIFTDVFVWIYNGNAHVSFQGQTPSTIVNTATAIAVRSERLADGGTAVVWSQYNAAEGQYETYARLFNADNSSRIVNGSAGPFEIQTFANTAVHEVVAMPNGNFAVVYTDTGWGDGNDLSLSVWRPDGTNVTEVPVNVNISTDGFDPDVTVLDNGFIVVSWDSISGSSSYNTFFRIFDQNGIAVTYDGSSAPRAFSSSADAEYHAEVAALGSGVFMGVWYDSGPTDGSNSHIAGSIHELVRTTTANSTETGTLSGDAIRDVMTGNAQSNRFEGGGGNDELRGRGGNDAYIVYGGDRIVEGAGEGTGDWLAAVNSYTLNFGAQVEEMWTFNQDHVSLTGNEFAQTITGNAGVNQLDGGGGTAADRLVGRGGSDTYIVRHTGDVIVEGASEGSFDSVSAAVSYTLAQGVHIESMGTDTEAAINLTGNSLTQRIAGNDAANQLDSGGGSDTLVGAGGNDSYIIRSGSETIHESAGGGVTDWLAAAVSYSLGASAQVEEMWTINSGATTTINLTGNIFVQLIVGNAGSNQLDSAGGTTVLRGLGGNDSYLIRTGFETIEEGAGQGTADYLVVGFDYTLAAGVQIEQMWTNSSGGTSGIDLTGNSFVQQITGNAGSNRLDSGGGSDTLSGLGGHDSYMIRSGTESIVEANGGGSDWLAAAVSYTLSANAYVEEMYTIASSATTAIHLTGNAFSQSIFGNAGANTLTGNGGGDFLIGYAGRDTLWGGAENDRFIFSAVTHSGSAIASADRIMDFRDTGGEQDLIDVRGIDADSGQTGGDQAFVLDTDGSFSTGEIRQTLINGNADLLLEFNNDTDAMSDMAIVMDGRTALLNGADFLL